MGGAAVTLCEAPDDRGGSWAHDGSIVFAPAINGALFRVSSSGGKPEPVTKLDEGEVSHRWPHGLPGGKTVLFTALPIAAIGNFENSNIVVESLPNGDRKIVQRGASQARYSRSGHIVYLHESTLFAAPFDLAAQQMTAQPVPVLEGIRSTEFEPSQNGHLVYLAGDSLTSDAFIYSMDRHGKSQLLRQSRASYSEPRFSPDGARLALSIFNQQFDIWIYQWGRDTLSPLTFDPSQDRSPVWTPDGLRITFRSTRAGASNLYWQRADGTGEAQRLTESNNHQLPRDWHPNGKFLAFEEIRPPTGSDIMILPMEGDETSGWKPGKPFVFLAGPFEDLDMAFSPDGRWLAYASNESGRYDVYVRPFPGPGGKWQISSGGGRMASLVSQWEGIVLRDTGPQNYGRDIIQLKLILSRQTSRGWCLTSRSAIDSAILIFIPMANASRC